MNAIVERQTVDWANTTVESAAASFAEVVHGEHDPQGVQHQLTATLIRLWNAAFGVSFFSCRLFLRQLAHENWSAVLGCDRIFQQPQYPELSGDFFGVASGWLLFTDDDDWYAPHVFRTLSGSADMARDVAIWPRTRFDGTIESWPVSANPLLCYTNNYAVRAKAIPRGHAVSPLMQHFEADRRVKAGLWSNATVLDTLSVTNKSPCSRNYLEKALATPSPQSAIRRSVEHYVESPSAVAPSLEWARPWMVRSRAFFAQALLSRRP